METFYNPTDKDLQHFRSVFRKYTIKSVLDVGAGNGVLLNKLALFIDESDINYVGIDIAYGKEIDKPIPVSSNVKFITESIGFYDYVVRLGEMIRFDCVISSWMGQYFDWRMMMDNLSSKLCILVLSQDWNTGLPQVYTGFKSYGYKLAIPVFRSSKSIIQVWSKVG